MNKLLLITLLLSIFYCDSAAKESHAMYTAWKDTEKAMWGRQINGLALLIKPDEQEYNIGDDIHIYTYVKNFGTNDTHLFWTRGVWKSVRMELYYEDGKPVLKTDYAAKIEKAMALPPPANVPRPPSSHSSAELKSNGNPFITKPVLNRFFKIDKPGTYNLILMRMMRSWEKGYLTSNMVKIKIVRKNTEQPALHPVCKKHGLQMKLQTIPYKGRWVKDVSESSDDISTDHVVPILIAGYIISRENPEKKPVFMCPKCLRKNITIYNLFTHAPP